jgi:tetratricopeptide (TPR) repeat protein/transcriptional regulator with XRE-family HTH domain
VAEEPALSFAGLLRQLRTEAALTQEELAEAAGVSPRSVSDLERGINRTAHKDTALLLAGGLNLAEPVRALFVAAARGKAPTADVLAARSGVRPVAFAAAPTRGLPRDIGSFTGRRADLAGLVAAVDVLATSGGVVGIHAIDGMAGIGKTAFAVHAAHRLAGAFPDGQFFLPLHAHTAGQRPVDPADALASLLLIAGVAAAQIPPGLEARAGWWRDQVAGKKILLVLDDAASHEQVWPLLPGTAGSLVLVTSRRRLTALHDATVISLDTLPPGEAAQLLARLADRPDLGSGAGPGGEIIQLCGYLPLAIGMIASQLRHHPAWSAADLAADLAAARDRLAVMRAEDVSVAAAFDLSYNDLTAGPQRLFRRLGLVPGPSVDGYAAAALDRTSLGQARRHLNELYDQHLIGEPAPGRYQLHDLLREHARVLAAADDTAESNAATGRLLNYYLHTALAAGQRFAFGVSAYRRPPTGIPPAHSPDLSMPGQAGAWLETERPNLNAATDYAATNGWHRHAIQIPGTMASFLIERGHWDQAAALYTTALTAARQVGDRLGEADALGELSEVQQETGDYPAATASLARALALYGEAGDLPGQAYALNILGAVQQETGDYPAATASHQQALALARAAGDRLAEADALTELGAMQQLTGNYPAAAARLHQALELLGELGNLQAQAYALNGLGMIQQETGDYLAAAASQQRALTLFRDFGNRRGQAYVLNDLGVVQRETRDYRAAAASHQQALALFCDFGDRLGQAEALNRLGELSSRTSATTQARDQHAQALAIARDINVPLEQAHALEGLGRSQLKGNNHREGLDNLRQALTIYQRIGSPTAQRVKETLQKHGQPSTTPEPQPTATSSEGHQPRVRTVPSESQ